MSAIRDIVVGDVHGCIDELNELLCTVSYNPERDRLVFVGDLVDRGPDSVGVVRRVRELGAICVLGNHDEWYVRYANHESRRRATGQANPLAAAAKKVALFEKLTESDVDWFASLPLYYFLDPKTAVVHAGFRPGLPVEQQDRNDMLRMRYVRRATGKMWSGNPGELMTPEAVAYWTEVWDGPEDVVYGHHPSKTDTVVTRNHGVTCWGIDTGCCFGNKLTAWLRAPGREPELVSVDARVRYAEWHKTMRDGD